MPANSREARELMQKHYSTARARVLRFATMVAVFRWGKNVGVLIASESRVNGCPSVWKDQQ
jgi:hypothetical protein